MLGLAASFNIRIMNTEKSSTLKKRGRPRSFDRDAVLEQAMRLFWQHGYETTSMVELLEVMQITTPSVYSAFGDKERLFLESVERYIKGPASYQVEACKEVTAKAAINRILREAAENYVNPENPRGCMLVVSTVNSCPATSPVQKAVNAARYETECALRGRIELGMIDGDVPKTADAAALASFFSTLLNGMSIKAKEGASKETMMALVDNAMRVWPES